MSQLCEVDQSEKETRKETFCMEWKRELHVTGIVVSVLQEEIGDLGTPYNNLTWDSYEQINLKWWKRRCKMEAGKEREQVRANA